MSQPAAAPVAAAPAAAAAAPAAAAPAAAPAAAAAAAAAAATAAIKKFAQVYTVKDVKADLFINEFAKHLKRSGKVELPKYVDVVKTGKAKELSPYNPDWYYVRAASIARHIYIHAGTGIGGFRKKYGQSYKRRGSRPEHATIAGGAIIQHALKQLEKLGLVEKDPNNGGRRITSQGRRDLDRIAQLCRKRKMPRLFK